MFLEGRKSREELEAEQRGFEMRQHRRMSLKTLVTVRAGRKEAHCKLSDLSLGGLAFLSPWRLRPNDEVTIVLRPPEGVLTFKKKPLPVNLEARVRRVKPTERSDTFLTGVEFLSPDDVALQLIRFWFESFGESIDPKSRRRER